MLRIGIRMWNIYTGVLTVLPKYFMTSQHQIQRVLRRGSIIFRKCDILSGKPRIYANESSWTSFHNRQRSDIRLEISYNIEDGFEACTYMKLVKNMHRHNLSYSISPKPDLTVMPPTREILAGWTKINCPDITRLCL